MDYPALYRSLSAQIGIATSAPLPLLVLIAIVTGVVWRVMVWRYEGIIQGLEERLKYRDEEIKRLTDSLQHLKIEKSPKPGSTTLNAKVAAIKQIESALVVTSSARAASAVMSGLLRAIPELNAAMLTAVKVFDLAKPPMRDERTKPYYALDLGHWLEEMLPLLKAGHVEEARERAKEILSETLAREGAYFLR